MKVNYLMEKKGITLVALIITIIVLLILAGITIGTINGNNSVIGQAVQTKTDTEIAEEKEILATAITTAVGKNKEGKITEKGLQKNLGDKATVSNLDETLIVTFGSGRSYEVDSVGNVSEFELILDNSPGDITKDKDGNELDGIEKPFEIWSIEDLVEFSMISNSYGGRTINTIKNKTVKICKNLDFKSSLSYTDANTKVYNEYLGISAELQDQIGLKEALTNETYEGFMPAKGATYFTLDGDGKAIRNIYINKESNAGLFSNGDKATIKNLEMTGKIQCAGNQCGAITAVYGTIQNCTSRVDITSTGRNTGGITGGQATLTGCTNYGTITGINYVGGVSGYNNTGTPITNCKNYGDVTGTTIVGGIYGQHGKPTGCENYGTITTTTGSVGGIGGDYGTCTNCRNEGTVTSTNGAAAGITATNGTVIGCINKGEITGKSLVSGITRGSAYQCINYGSVKSTANKAGGISAQPGYIVNCINKGPVEATTNLAGGIAGFISSSNPIINCINEGSVTAPTRVGGIVGGVDATGNDTSRTINCFNIGTLTGTSHVAELVGNKAGYGIYYINHSYGLDRGNDNLLYGTVTSGEFNVADSSKYELSYMKTAPFLKLLNDYVDAYNVGETKTDSNNYDLYSWAFDEKTGCPTLVFPAQSGN